jgi:hypothetical protein
MPNRTVPPFGQSSATAGWGDVVSAPNAMAATAAATAVALAVQ